MPFLLAFIQNSSISSGIKYGGDSAMTISENQPISVSNFSSAISTTQSSLVGNVQVTINANTEDKVPPSHEGAYEVNISQEATDLQAKEGDSSQKDQAEPTEKSNSEESISVEGAEEAFGSETPQSYIEEQIKKLKKQIQAIKEKITELANDDSEAAQQQRQTLETQLLELTTRLLTLVNEMTNST
jgi:hypothetical protein